MLGGGRVIGDVPFCPAQTTHPICASLDHPLFACGGKRVAKKDSYNFFFRQQNSFG